MSTGPTSGSPQAPLPAAVAQAPEPVREIRIISHCSLFYWWPVWALGFIMALLTSLTNQRMVLVDKGADYVSKVNGAADGKPITDRAAWVLPEGKSIPHREMLHVSPNKNLGVLFSIILLLVIGITNVPLRGLWSVIVLVLIVSISIIFALLEWWEKILATIQILDIRINLEGYLLISTVLLALWLVVFFFFDAQIYMTFTPGQLRVRQAIGDAETAYDTTGMTIQKQRSDLFRHWILGIGSGDLIVNTTGAQSHHFEMPNVLFLGRKVNQIEMMLSSRQVVATKE